MARKKKKLDEVGKVEEDEIVGLERLSWRGPIEPLHGHVLVLVLDAYKRPACNGMPFKILWYTRVDVARPGADHVSGPAGVDFNRLPVAWIRLMREALNDERLLAWCAEAELTRERE